MYFEAYFSTAICHPNAAAEGRLPKRSVAHGLNHVARRQLMAELEHPAVAHWAARAAATAPAPHQRGFYLRPPVRNV